MPSMFKALLAQIRHLLGAHPTSAAVAALVTVLLAVLPLIGVPHHGPVFVITGTTTSLLPGVPGQLTLVLSNPAEEDLTVTFVRVTAQDAGPGCTKANLAVRPFVGTVALRKHSTATITLPITLSAYAPEACRLVVFPLSFSGKAVGR